MSSEKELMLIILVWIVIFAYQFYKDLRNK